MQRKINIFVLLRFLLGCLFFISGGEKIINPIANFQYVVEGYEFFPPIVQNFVIHVTPWIELIAGMFCILGLWTKWAFRGVLLLFIGFIIIVFQAIIRNLPITECGCFGELISFPLPVILMFDSVMFLITLLLIKKIQQATQFSLDNHFNEEK